MNNLPFSATEETVTEFFSKYGEVVSVKLLQRVKFLLKYFRKEDLQEKDLFSSRLLKKQLKEKLQMELISKEEILK